MPGMTGLELLAHVRQTQPYATRILITGVVNLDTVVEAINQGEIFRFIVKPWLREEFLATVKNGVQRYELICQNARLQAGTQAMNEQLLELNRSLEQHVQLVEQKNREFAEETPPSNRTWCAPWSCACIRRRRSIPRWATRRGGCFTFANPWARCCP